jgi:hypothetical protein
MDFDPNLLVNYFRLNAKFDLLDFAVDSMPFK